MSLIEARRHGMSARRYSNSRLEKLVREAFYDYRVEEVCTDLLRTGPGYRHPNKANLDRLTIDMQMNGFRTSEAVLVWKMATGQSTVILGGQRLHAAKLEQT